MGFIWDDAKQDDDKFKAHILSITKQLTDTRDGLLADITKLKAKLKEFEGIEPEEFKRIKDELEALKKSSGTQETEIQKQFNELKKQNDALQKIFDEMAEDKKKMMVDDEITKSLVGYKVKPDMLEAAVLIIKGKVAVVKEEGKDVARIGDKKIADYIKDWVATSVGKNFVLADNNTGGDSGGNDDDNTEGGQEKYYDKSSGHFNLTKQVLLKKSNPTLHAKLSKKFKK